ncbi:tyrosine-type recombinase/integrase [Geomicrobium sediminis]|uniref:Integrase n=1 Tax=Geomicrobium sediminis TaxID=1347788 RepID=A0ABS2PIS2_9BACL|nr:tyrosine-type recombinase/integrase [Geomicrobium sediminis]MBM7634930.1 integrase [Geomicrobium sediminis]
MTTGVGAISVKADRDKMKQALTGRNKAMFIIGVSVGLRISDLLQLRIGDLRNKDNVTITEQKTGKQRTITLSQTVKDEVAKMEGADDEFMFKSQKGANQPISRVQAYRILNDAAQKAGIAAKIGRIGTHTLRKTFGAIAYKNGTDITELMYIFGHSTPRMTLNYIGITSEKVADVYKAIEV